MRSACSHRAFASAKTQELHVRWELGGLMTVAGGLLSDITTCVAFMCVSLALLPASDLVSNVRA